MINRPDDKEVVAIVLAIDEIIAAETMGEGGLRFMCQQAALMIRRMRPDLAFKEGA